MKRLIHISILLFSLTTFGQQLAFPSAQGFGKYASGGRGGEVIKVTNLNASGNGSLRAALEANGTRTIVFTVGGTIDLAGTNIYVNNGNVTIAGQTAPGDGILIKGGEIEISTNNVIVRYIRVRPGSGSLNDSDGIGITAWNGTTVENIILDHCSISWATDENFNIRTIGSGIVKNVTLQNSIISEAIYGMLSTSITSPNVRRISVLRNYFALNSERSITANYPNASDISFEFANNLIHGFREATQPSVGTKFTVLNNIYSQSYQITDTYSNTVVSVDNDGTGSLPNTYAYISGNVLPNGFNTYSSSINAYIKNTPFASSGFVAQNTVALLADMLPSVGCSISRDTVDKRVIQNFYDRNGTIANTGDYPAIQGGVYPPDTDNDGMSDAWELSHYGTLDNNGRADTDANGYTDLEDYLDSIMKSATLGVGEVSVKAKDYSCQIYNVLGQLVYEGKLMDFKPLSAGVYLIKYNGVVVRGVYDSSGKRL